MSKDKKETKNISDAERTLVDLTMEAREPKTDSEKRLAEQIKAIKAKGLIVDIPFDI